MIEIKVTSDADLMNLAIDAIHILSNMRDAQKNWQEYHGSELLYRKRLWEGNADKFLAALKVNKSFKANELKIEISEPPLE